MDQRDQIESNKRNARIKADPQHFMFEGVDFAEIIAHDGNGLILAYRVLESHAGTAVNFIDLVVVPSGHEIGIHTHAEDNEEMYIIIPGQGEMMLNGKQLEVSSGHVVVNRPGGTHSLKNTGDMDVQLVVIEVSVPVFAHHSRKYDSDVS